MDRTTTGLSTVLLVVAVAVVGAVVGGCAAPRATVRVVPAGSWAPVTTSTTPASSTSATAASTTTSTTEPATTAAPTTTVPIVAAAPAPSSLSVTLAQGMRGPAVLALQQRLKAMAFDPGALDGAFMVATTQSVWAYQHLMGMPATGAVTPALWDRMQQPFSLVPRGGGTTHFEVDIAKQVGVLFVAGAPRLITHVSTGSGQRFCADGGCGVAVTPAGSYRFGGRYTGWQKGSLGSLFNPIYFNGGIAVHGALSVPNSPASHGCVRIPMHIAAYFPSLVRTGDAVYVYGTSVLVPGGPPPSPRPTPPPTSVPPSTVPTATTTTTNVPGTTTTTSVPGTTSTTGAPGTTTTSTTSTVPPTTG